jgi:hypothetical protein
MKKLKNTTEIDLLHNYTGQSLPSGVYVEIDQDHVDRLSDSQMHDWFEDGSVIYNDGTTDQSHWLNGWLNFSGERYADSVAVDMVESEDEDGVTSGTDQSVSGTDWVKVETKRVIWGLNNTWDLVGNGWSPTVNGIFFHDPQIRMKDMVDVTRVEIGIFVDNELWWVSDQKDIASGVSSIILRGAVHIDAYVGSTLDVRVRLTGTSPTAKVDWDDDWTAWGFALKDLLV